MVTALSRIPTPLAVLAVGALVVCGSVASAALADASPAPTFTTFSTPTAASNPGQIAAGSDGNLWFVEPGSNSIGRVTPAGAITEFALPTADAGLFGIAAGPDGNIWFTENSADQVGMITPAGAITEYPLTANAGPEGIAAGADGNLWIAEFGLGDIGVVSPAGVVLQEYAVGLVHTSPINVVLGSDDRIWFGLNNTDDIAAIDTSGTLVEAVTTEPVFYLAEGADGNVWFSGATSNHDGGTVTPAGVVTNLPAVDALFSMTAGPDGDIWGDDAVNGKIDEVDPTGNVVASYLYSPAIATGSLSYLAEGSDGNIWFTLGDHQVGVLNLHPTAAPTPTLPSTGVGPGSWIAGAAGLGALVVGILAVLLASWRRPRRIS